ncbi:hypothetical protein NHQ30_001069 [Ciborinia camelliae]|nr:hypothetical protein NHQ30_001069 [Ciborinia camelliae]
MSTTTFTKFSCGHVEESTRIDTGRGSGLRGIIQKLRNRKKHGFATANLNMPCSVCEISPTPNRGNSTEPPQHPLRSHPIAHAPEPKRPEEDAAHSLKSQPIAHAPEP